MTEGAKSLSGAQENNISVSAIKNWLLKQGFLWYECPFCGFFWPQTDEGLLSNMCTCYQPRSIPLLEGVFVTWKPLLEFVKGDRIGTPDFMKDSVVVSEPPYKSLHEWAQSPVEAAHFISRRTVENDTVLDPFLGSGTVCVAALKLNRQFIGAEIEPERLDVARARISKYQQELRSTSNPVPAEVPAS